MPDRTARIVQVGWIAMAAMLTTEIRAQQIRPTRLVLAGENYNIIYRGVAEKRNRAIVTLDNGREVTGEGFLLFREGKTLGTANIAGKHYRFLLTQKEGSVVEVPKAPSEPAGRPDTVTDPNDRAILNQAQLDALIAEKIASRTRAVAGDTIGSQSIVQATNAGAPPANTAPVIITIMVLYDQDAVSSLEEYGGGASTDNIYDTIEMSVAEANEAYANCGLNVQLNLVYTGQIECAESGSLTTDLHWLAGNANVAGLRSQYGADVVTMMEGANDPQYSGMAYLLTGTGTAAFNVVEAIYSVNDYVLAHEVGHNLGCAHDRANAPAQGAYDFSYGLNFGPVSTITGGPAYGTIMCYPGARIGMFSSPTNYYLGYATGTPSDNNVETIALRAPWIASLTPEPVYTVTLEINGTGTVIQNGTATNPATIPVMPGQSLNLVAAGNFVCWSGATNTTASNITICPSQSTNLVANFVVDQPPVIVQQPLSLQAVIGGTAVFNVFAEAVDPTYQWHLNGTPIPSATTKRLVISAVTSQDAGNYTAAISSSGLTVESAPAQLIVLTTPPAISPMTLTIAAASDAQLGVSFSGTNAENFQIQASADLVHWDTIGTNAGTAGINQFIDTNVSRFSRRFYRVKVVQ